MRYSTVFLLLLLTTTIKVRAEVVIETVTVGNPGNAGELSGEAAGGWGWDRVCGAVDYVYEIGKFEVTAGQYTEFLNAVADTDTYGLYHTTMWSSSYGSKIERAGSTGGYTYSVAADWADRPVNFVTWGDAARFANWLHNGQPTGAQDLSTTEDGSYNLSATHSYYGPDGEVPPFGTDDFWALHAALSAVDREPNATWVVPSEDEWYKAAYHCNDGATGNYWDYPTGSDAVPNNGHPDGDTGNSATFYSDPPTIGPPYWRTETGFFGLSASPYGTFDQGGNVWEINDTRIYYSEEFPPTRGSRGGCFIWYGRDDWLTLHAAFRDEVGGGVYGRLQVGFRVGRVWDADIDNDGDVDLYDYALWQRAVTGPR